MKILLIDNEREVRLILKDMVAVWSNGMHIIDEADGVASGVQKINSFQPDIVLLDVEMNDGTGFDLLKQLTNPSFQLIFTTAHNQYAIQAFKFSAIDYLLKPVKKEELSAAIEKYKSLSQQKQNTLPDINKLLAAITVGEQSKYKKRFAVKYGEHLKTINVEDVAYYYTEDKINFLTTKEGRRFTIDFNLDTLESMLDPKTFFRINRQYIISIQSIAEMFTYSKSRVLIKLNPPAKHETVVSTERSADFKLWLGDEK